MRAPIKQLRIPTSRRLVRLFLSFVAMSSAIFHLTAASQQPVVVPPTRGFVEYTYDPTSNMTTTTYTFRLAYIASEVSPIVQLLAEHQRAAVEKKIVENVLQIQGGNSTTLVVDNATTIINVTTSVLSLRAVPNANVLFEEGIMHTTFVDGLNVAVIAEAPNITFTTFQQPMNIKMIDDYPNMEVVLLPIQQVAFEAGLLASAIVLQSFTIAIMYSHFYRDSINGLRNAVVQECPLCYVKAFGVCAGSFECPGQWDRFIAFAGNADVVITGAHVSDLLPTMVFRFNKHNATKLGLPKKYVIVIGDVLNNIGSAVKRNPYFMGVLRIQLDSTLSNLVEGLVFNNFTATVQTAPSAWDRSFTNASINNPGVTNSRLSQFILNTQLFKWGTFTPVYDAIDKAAEDADRIGGLPFVPIGDVLTGFDQNIEKWSTAVAEPSISDNTAATCELHDRYVVISSDLKYASVISTQQAQAKQIPLRISDKLFAQGANNSKLSSYYDYSLRPDANATPRVRMLCSMIPDSTYGNPNVWMLSGGVYLNATTGLGMNAQTNPNSVVHETLRLRLVCVDPYSIWCDFFVLENMTALVTSSSVNDTRVLWHGSPSGIGANLLTPRGVSATTSNVSFLLQSYDSLSTAAIRAASGVRMGVVERPDVINVTNTIRVLPPAAFADTDVALFRPVNISWSTTLRGMLAVDLHRRVVVFLPIMDLVPPDGGTPHAASAPWWGMNGSSAAPTSIRWLDYSSTIPVTITVSDDSVSRTLPCTVKSLVYLSSLDRLAIILRASYSGTNPGALSGDDANPTDVVSVFHFSSVLRQWVLQSSMKIFRTTAGTQDYAVLPLQDLLGGGWLLYPTLPSSSLVGMAVIVYDVSSFNTFTTCDTSRGLAISRDGTSCYVCASRQVATIDGFCTDEKKNISDCHECHWVIPFVAAVGASIFIVLVVMLLIHMFRTSWSQKARITTLRERSTKFTNAPPSGRTPILTLMIVDADVLWQTGGENLLESEEYTTKHRSSSIDDATTNGTTEQNSEINSKGKRHHREKASTEFVLRILDSLHKSLCGSIAANNGYLAEYRGEVAVVVHNNPAALMCIALEASLAMALHQPPVRLAVALHIGNVVRSVDVKGTKKCVFAGEGMNVAARIASLSATTGGFVSGAWMASQQFVAKLMDESPGAMKALALSRGATSQIRYENIVTEVQEITSALLVDALGDQTSFDLARQRRTKHLKELRNNTKAATMAAKTSDLKKHHATEGGTRPRTVHYALHARRSSDGTHGENETTHFAVDVSDAPPHQNQQTQVENPLSPQQHFSTALHDPPPLPLQPAPAVVVVVAVVGNSTSQRDSGASSSVRRPARLMTNHGVSATDVSPPLFAGGRGEGNTKSESSGSAVVQPRSKPDSQFSAASPCLATSNLQDDPISPILDRMCDSRRTKLSLNERDRLETFAGQIGRVLFSQLPTAPIDILVNRLHLPNYRKNQNTGKYPAVMPKTSLRHFSQRVVAMASTDLESALSCTRAALAVDTSHNTIGNWESGPVGRADAFSVGKVVVSASTARTVRSEGLAQRQCQSPTTPVLRLMGSTASATLSVDDTSPNVVVS